jgi:hypothetical protein
LRWPFYDYEEAVEREEEGLGGSHTSGSL